VTIRIYGRKMSVSEIESGVDLLPSVGEQSAVRGVMTRANTSFVSASRGIEVRRITLARRNYESWAGLEKLARVVHQFDSVRDRRVEGCRNCHRARRPAFS
jgi:hypothetical protein